jgi:hypothetical protein
MNGAPLFTDDAPFLAMLEAKTREEVPGRCQNRLTICNLGYGDRGTLHPRLPRLAFSEACSLL